MINAGMNETWSKLFAYMPFIRPKKENKELDKSNTIIASIGCARPATWKKLHTIYKRKPILAPLTTPPSA